MVAERNNVLTGRKTASRKGVFFFKVEVIATLFVFQQE